MVEVTKEDDALHIIFDGPPGPTAGRFVECENSDGYSVNAGEWHERRDGLWELVIPRHTSTAASEARIAELEGALGKVIEAAERALGDHCAPHDCYATGPLTGNPIADLIACPGCAQIDEIAVARQALTKGPTDAK